MKHVERELERLQQAIGRPHWRQGELRAAAAALRWALNPGVERTPMVFVTGKPEMEPEKLPTPDECLASIGGMQMVVTKEMRQRWKDSYDAWNGKRVLRPKTRSTLAKRQKQG
jgi:hypothetical protein